MTEKFVKAERVIVKKVKIVDSTGVGVEIEDGSLALMIEDFDGNVSNSLLCFKNVLEDNIGVFINTDRGIIVRVPFKYVKFIDKDFYEESNEDSSKYDFTPIISKYDRVCEFGFELNNIDEYDNLIYINRRDSINLKIIPKWNKFELSSVFLMDIIPVMYKSSFLEYDDNTFSEINETFKDGLMRLTGHM